MGRRVEKAPMKIRIDLSVRKNIFFAAVACVGIVVLADWAWHVQKQQRATVGAQNAREENASRLRTEQSRQDELYRLDRDRHPQAQQTQSAPAAPAHNANDPIIPCEERGATTGPAYLVARENTVDDFNGAVSRMNSIDRGDVEYQAIGDKKNMLVMFYSPPAEKVAESLLEHVMSDKNAQHQMCVQAFQKVAAIERSITGRLRVKFVYAITAEGALKLSDEAVFKMQMALEK
jgi:hypothetical protein